MALLAIDHELAGIIDKARRRTIDLEHGEIDEDGLEVELHADFDLVGAVGRERLAGIVGGTGSDFTWRQAFDVIGIDRYLVDWPDDEAERRGEGMFVIGTGVITA